MWFIRGQAAINKLLFVSTQSALAGTLGDLPDSFCQVNMYCTLTYPFIDKLK
jgi:hypothetical protein